MFTRFRDTVSHPLTVEYFHQRLSQGWIITAVEWARPLSKEAAAIPEETAEVPYGQQVADDCGQLTDHPQEMEVVAFIYNGVISGWRPAHVAAELNLRNYRDRAGHSWTAAAIFDLMPRIIELSPRLQRRLEWPQQRARLQLNV